MPTGTGIIQLQVLVDGVPTATTLLGQVNIAMNNVGKSAAQTSNQLSFLGHAASTAFGFIAGAVVIGGLKAVVRGMEKVSQQVVESIGDYQRLGQVIKAASAREIQFSGMAEGKQIDLHEAYAMSTGDATKYLKVVQNLALTRPVSEKSIADIFRTLAGYQLGVDLSMDYTKGLVDFGVTTGRTSEELYRLALAIGQVKAKGKLMGEEMRQLGNAGMTVDLIVKGLNEKFPKMGVTIGNFYQKMRAGALASAPVLEALLAMLEEFSGMGKDMAKNWFGIPIMLENIKRVLLRTFFAPVFNEIAKPLGAFFDLWDVEKHPGALKGIESFGDALGKLIQGPMEQLTKDAIPKLNAFLIGLQGGNLWAAIGNVMGLGISQNMSPERLISELTGGKDLGDIVKDWIDVAIPKVEAESIKIGWAIMDGIIAAFSDEKAATFAGQIISAIVKGIGAGIGGTTFGAAKRTAEQVAPSVGVKPEGIAKSPAELWAQWEPVVTKARYNAWLLTVIISKSFEILATTISNTFNSVVSTVNTAITQMKVNVLSGILTAYTTLTQIDTIISISVGRVGTTLSQLWGIITIGLGVVKATMSSWLDAIKTKVQGVFDSIWGIVNKSIFGVLGELGKVFLNIAQILGTLFINTTASIGNFINNAIQPVITKFNEVKTTVLTVLGIIGPPLLTGLALLTVSIGEGLINAFNAFIAKCGTVINTVGNVISIISGLSRIIIDTLISQGLSWLQQELSDAMLLWDTFRASINLVATATASFSTTVLAGVNSALNSLQGFLSDINTRLDTFKTSIKDKTIFNIGADLIAGLISGIDSKMSELQKKIDEVSLGIPKWIMDKLLARSPSIIMREIGSDIMDGLILGIESRLPALDRTLILIGRKIDMAFPNRRTGTWTSTLTGKTETYGPGNLGEPEGYGLMPYGAGAFRPDWLVKAGETEKGTRKRIQNLGDMADEAASALSKFEKAMSKIQGLISGLLKPSEGEAKYRGGLVGTSAQMGDAWDEIARQWADIAKLGKASPFYKIFKGKGMVPPDIADIGGQPLQSFAAKMEQDFYKTPFASGANIGILVQNLKDKLISEADNQQLVAAIWEKFKLDPNAAALLTAAGYDAATLITGSVKDGLAGNQIDLWGSIFGAGTGANGGVAGWSDVGVGVAAMTKGPLQTISDSAITMVNTLLGTGKTTGDLSKNVKDTLIPNINTGFSNTVKGLDRVEIAINNIDFGGGDKEGGKGKVPPTTQTDLNALFAQYGAGQRGIDFTVPSGFPSDSYPFRALLQTGERVEVIPRHHPDNKAGRQVNINIMSTINSNLDVALVEQRIMKAIEAAI